MPTDTVLCLTPDGRRLPAVCEQAYRRAQTRAGTLAVDGMRSDPNPGPRRAAAEVRCGVLREAAPAEGAACPTSSLTSC
jgi:hypothetical protein